MKNLFILLLAMGILYPLSAQNRKYTRNMMKTIELLNGSTDRETSLECVRSFDALASEYPDQWLPEYYAARALINMTFEDPDIEQGDSQLDQADAYIKAALEMADEESELYVLKALSKSARITLEPDYRGQLYYEDVVSSLNKAKQLNPGNPRAAFLDAILTLNLPDFMGGGPSAAKPKFVDAMEKFKEYRNSDPLWPDWGEEQNQQQLAALQ